MPKYRKFPVKTTESLILNDMPDDTTRLMWVMMPLALCREGRGVDHPAWLKSRIFPLRDPAEITTEFVCGAMDWYEERGLIVRYQVDGRRYFYVPTFHDDQGSTVKEAESIYPPPDGAPADAQLTPEQVESGFRAAQEPVATDSSSDADADANTSTESRAPAASPGGERDETPSPPSTFAEWYRAVEDSDNRYATLRWMIKVLYPKRDLPAYGYLGKVAKQVGGAGRLADLLWQHSTRPPTGDLLAYILAVAKGKGAKQSGEPVEEVPLATGWVDDE